MNAKQTLKQARDLQARMQREGYAVSLKDAFTLARVAQRAAVETEAELRKQSRRQRQQRADVAGYVDDMRSAGAWDGE